MSESPYASPGPARQQVGQAAEQPQGQQNRQGQRKSQQGQQQGQPRSPGESPDGTAGRDGQATGEDAGTAQEKAHAASDETRQQAREMAHDLRERVTREARSQTVNAAEGLRQWADDLAGMADRARPGSPVRGLIHRCADSTRRAADAMDERGFDGLIDGLESFARRSPVAFLGSAALAGLAVGRLAKGGSDAHHGAGRDSSSSYAEGGERRQKTMPSGTSTDGHKHPAPGYQEVH